MNMVLRGLQAADARSLFFAAMGVLLLAMTPHGILSGNEEQYLAEAFRTVRPDAWPAASNLLGGFPHAFVFNRAMGTLVDAFGFPTAQALGRGAAIVLYSLGLMRMFRHLGLTVLDLLVVLVAFLLAGESLIGNEWMFRGIEPKVPAYGLVLLALCALLRGRPAACYAMLVPATYLHAFVGGFWAVIFTMVLLARPQTRRATLVSGAVAALAVLPFALFLLRHDYAQFDAGAPDAGPPAGWILTYVAYPWHTTPFVDLRSVVRWLPGIVSTVLVAVFAGMALRRLHDDPMRRVAALALLAAVWVCGALALTWLFDDGRLGPFVLFRPSGMGLLLALVLLMLVLRTLPAAQLLWLRIGMLVALVPAALPVLQQEYLYPAAREVMRHSDQRPLLAWIAEHSTPEDVFLVEPAIEEHFFDFERNTRRASLFVHRFTPGSAADIRAWYERYQYAQTVFGKGCASARAPARVDYLVTSSDTAQRIALSCGKVVFDANGFSLIALGPAGPTGDACDDCPT